MRAAHNVAINVHPMVNETMFIIVSVLFEVISKSFMVLYLCLKFDKDTAIVAMFREFIRSSVYLFRLLKPSYNSAYPLP